MCLSNFSTEARVFQTLSLSVATYSTDPDISHLRTLDLSSVLHGPIPIGTFTWRYQRLDMRYQSILEIGSGRLGHSHPIFSAPQKYSLQNFMDRTGHCPADSLPPADRSPVTRYHSSSKKFRAPWAFTSYLQRFTEILSLELHRTLPRRLPSSC